MGITLPPAVRQVIEGRIDFPSQQWVEQWQHRWLLFGGICSFALGFWYQSLAVTLQVYAACTLGVLLVCVPPWPWYNKYDTQWAPVRPSAPSTAQDAQQ